MENDDGISFDPENTFALKDLLKNDAVNVDISSISNLQTLLSQLIKTELVREIFSGSSEPFQHLNPEIINKFTDKTALHPSNAESDLRGENASSVCYAESSEVRDEFKIDLPPQHFTEKDILNYVFGAILENINSEKDMDSADTMLMIPYPRSQYSFWKMANKGEAYWLKNHKK